jgi:hypothetical protein
MSDDTPVLRFAFEARVEIGPTEHVGRGPDEQLAITPITGGVVEGPRLQGTVVGVGGDWSVTRGTCTQLDARYLFRAEDGALIDIVNRGYYRDDDHYFRTSPVFRTDAPAHRWLAETVLVGMAREEDGKICIRFFEVL